MHTLRTRKEALRLVPLLVIGAGAMTSVAMLPPHTPRKPLADLNAPLSPANKLSINMKPVTGGISNNRSMRPDTGVQPNVTENSRISSSAHQNTGIE